LAFVLTGSMVVLVVVLTRASSSGREAIERYVASIKKGETVSVSVGGREADAVTKALRDSRSFSIANFQSQQDTACFWVTLRNATTNVDARFVLAERSSKQEVTAASLARECECPVDVHRPCGLRD
jgi:hypothetical protein